MSSGTSAREYWTPWTSQKLRNVLKIWCEQRWWFRHAFVRRGAAQCREYVVVVFLASRWGRRVIYRLSSPGQRTTMWDPFWTPHTLGSVSTKKLLYEVASIQTPSGKKPHAFPCPTSPTLVHCFSPATIPRSHPATDRRPRSHLLRARSSSLHYQQRADGGIIQ